VEESLDLFARMRAGEFPDGSMTLRAKIDLASGNFNMRDPVIYRINHAHHHRQGDKWCVYPMYDFAHPIEDMLEGITHSLCSLEFEDHRPLYNWVVEHVDLEADPRQIEFARLNINYTVMSKRKLRQLVEAYGTVSKKASAADYEGLWAPGPDGKLYTVKEAYGKIMDFAWMQTATGTYDFQTAVREATKKLLERGLRVIPGKDGRSYRLEYAVRSYITNRMGEMFNAVNQMNYDAIGADGWEISAHPAPAPDHALYQGRQYSKEEYDRINNSLARKFGWWNCRHLVYPIRLGVSPRAYSDEQLQKYLDEARAEGWNDEPVVIAVKSSQTTIATLTTAYLDAAGIPYELQSLEDSAYNELIGDTANNWDLFFAWFNYSSSPTLIDSKLLYNRWINEEKDAVIEKMLQLIPGSPEYLELWNTLAEMMVDDCAFAYMSMIEWWWWHPETLHSNDEGLSRYVFNTYWDDPENHTA